MNPNAPYRPSINVKSSRRSDNSPPGTVRSQGLIKIGIVALILLAVFTGGVLPILAMFHALFGSPF